MGSHSGEIFCSLVRFKQFRRPSSLFFFSIVHGQSPLRHKFMFSLELIWKRELFYIF